MLQRVGQGRARSVVGPRDVAIDGRRHDVVEPGEAERVPLGQIEGVGVGGLLVCQTVVEERRAAGRDVAFAVVLLPARRPRCIVIRPSHGDHVVRGHAGVHDPEPDGHPLVNG